jgi:KaiC/GvpD/RAD55 family RecA-like ATPase
MKAEAVVTANHPSMPANDAAVAPKYPLLRDAVAVGSSLDQPWPEIPFVIRDLGICAGAMVLLVAYGFTGKTLFASHLALAVASGRPLFGRYQVERGRVLHIDCEQGTTESLVRYRLLANGLKLKVNEIGDVQYLSNKGFLLDGAGSEDILRDAVNGFQLCIIDSLRAMISSDENDSRVRQPLDMLTRVSEETRCTFLIIHHAGKGSRADSRQTPRGSSAIFDAAGTVLLLEKDADGTIEVSQPKSRSVNFSGMTFRFQDSGEYIKTIGRKDTLRLVPVDDAPPERPLRERIVMELRNSPASSDALRRRLKVNKKTFLAVLRTLSAENIVISEVDSKDSRKSLYRVNEDRAAWQVPMAGHEAVEAQATAAAKAAPGAEPGESAERA